jgi:hypothetical protein
VDQGRYRTVARGALAIAWMATACWSASAAELTTTVSRDSKTIVLVNGSLAAGDAGRVRDLLKAAAAAGKPVSAMRFNSSGGSLVEAVRLAAVVQGAKMATVVMAGATCAAACFVPFVAGNQKYVSATASVGAPGAAARQEPSGQTPAIVRGETPSVVRVLKELGLLDAIVTKMLAKAEDDVTWLTLDDLRAMGATITGRPVLQRPDTQQ